MAKANANTHIITLKNKYASITISLYIYISTTYWHYMQAKYRISNQQKTHDIKPTEIASHNKRRQPSDGNTAKHQFCHIIEKAG